MDNKIELTEVEIQANRKRFLDLTTSITRPNIDMDRLISQLDSSDFFTAPASTQYHNSYRGGLCAHCLNVYDTLCKFVNAMYSTTDENGETTVNSPYSEDTLKIVALFHDFDKMNKYEQYVRNVKVYSELGLKHDEMGKFDWQAVPGYKWKEDKDIFVFGTHGENSAYMTETFIPLSTEEHAAILNHSSVYDNPKLNITGIYNRYSLACLLHLADMASTYILEKC